MARKPLIHKTFDLNPRYIKEIEMLCNNNSNENNSYENPDLNDNYLKDPIIRNQI